MIAQETVEQVPIGKVKPAPDNVRDTIGDVSELAMSIKDGGIQQPLVAVQRNGHFEVVFGHRRLAAAELAGADTVPVIVREYSEPDRVLAMATENLQRENLTPLEEARAYKRLLEICNCSQRDLAPRIGKTQSHISKRLALLELPKDVQTKVDSGGITIADAVELAKLAGHPKRLKHALESAPWQDVATRVRVELDDLAREEKVRTIAEEIESNGMASLIVKNEWQLPKGVHRLKGGSHYDAHALEITAAKHETHDCHAIAITHAGLKFPVCTNRKNHPAVKTQQEKNAAGNGARRTPVETPKQKQLNAARARRLEFAGRLIAKKPPKEAINLLLLDRIEFALEDYGALDDADYARVGVWLGLFELAEEGVLDVPDGLDVVALIKEFANRGEAELQRAALALFVAELEAGYSDVTSYIGGRHSGYRASTTWGYLKLLQAQGDALGPDETKALEQAA